MIAACSVPKQSVSIPDDVAYVVVAELDEAGQITRLSPLGPWTPGVTVVSQAERYRLLGYTAEQLAPFGVVDEELPPEPLQIADGCRVPLLPTPRIQLDRINGDWMSANENANPRLTARFAAGACINLSREQLENWRIDDRCSDEPLCDVRPSFIGPCAASFNLENCGGGRLDVSVGPTGDVCAALLGRPETCRQRQRTNGLAGLSCTNECTIDIYSDARTAEAPFSVEHIDFTQDELRTPLDGGPAPFVIGPHMLRWGYSQAM
ncbi:MAG: hypothetical protein AAFN74_22055, partial [Myxococcota bacterium]